MPTTHLVGPRPLLSPNHTAAKEHTLIGNLISTDGMIIARHAVSFKGNQRLSSVGRRKK
ncbi:MAG TPA: hypothetical protein VMW72_01145 [Sedimentisphaerales bacterium]|nr:hypothetical protein [Sedimentisphaerales bacterium]